MERSSSFFFLDMLYLRSYQALDKVLSQLDYMNLGFGRKLRSETQIKDTLTYGWGFPGGSIVKNTPVNAGDARDAGSISGLGRSSVVGRGDLLQYSCLKNPTNRGTWWATIQRVSESGMAE